MNNIKTKLTHNRFVATVSG